MRCKSFACPMPLSDIISSLCWRNKAKWGQLASFYQLLIFQYRNRISTTSPGTQRRKIALSEAGLQGCPVIEETEISRELWIVTGLSTPIKIIETVLMTQRIAPTFSLVISYPCCVFSLFGELVKFFHVSFQFRAINIIYWLYRCKMHAWKYTADRAFGSVANGKVQVKAYENKHFHSVT